MGGGGGSTNRFLQPKKTFTFLFCLLSFFPSFFLPLLPPFFPSFPPSLLPFFFSSFLSMKNMLFFSWPLIQIFVLLGQGVIYYTKLEVPKNIFTFLFLPPFLPSFFLSLFSFSLLPSFLLTFLLFLFSCQRKTFFSQPLIQICTFGGAGGVIYYTNWKCLKTHLHSLFASFLSSLPSFFPSFLHSFPPSLLPFFFSSFLSTKNMSFFPQRLI